MKHKYELTRPDSPTFKIKTNQINGLVRVTNSYIKDGIKYEIKVMSRPLKEYLVWGAGRVKYKLKYYDLEEVYNG